MHKLTNDRMKWGLGAVLAGAVLAGGLIIQDWVGDRIVGRGEVRLLRVLRPKQHVRILAVALSPTGSVLATAGYDHKEPIDHHSVCLWDTRSGRLLHTLAGHRNGVGTLAFSPTGGIVASGSYDKTLNLWDVRTGRLKHTLRGQCGYVKSVAFSPDGRRVASAEVAAVNIWDTNTGSLMRRINGRPDEQLDCVTYSPDGGLLAAAAHIGIMGSSGEIILWDAQTYRLRRRLAGCSTLAFSPDGAVIAGDGGDATASGSSFSWGVYLWNVNTGRMRTRVLGGWQGMSPVAFVNGGRTIVTGGSSIRMWSSSSGYLRRQLQGGEYGFNSFAVSADGKILAGACDGGPAVKLWSLR